MILNLNADWQTANAGLSGSSWWEWAAAIDPRLNDIKRKAQASRGQSIKRYEELKRELSRCVGWGARYESLGTSEAFENGMRQLAKWMRI